LQNAGSATLSSEGGAAGTRFESAAGPLPWAECDSGAITNEKLLQALLPRRLPALMCELQRIDYTRIRHIDSPDRNDHLAVSFLVNDIYTYYRHCEVKWMPNPNYMSLQRDINERMRAILIDWLVDVHERFRLLPEVLYLTVNLIDRFLSECAVARQKLQLVGVTAMLIASKYEEIYAPEVRDFVYISDRAYEREEILHMEAVMLNILKFDLTVPSALKFLERWLKVAGASEREQYFAKFCLELCLVEYQMLRYAPSLVAASCVLASRRLIAQLDWDDTLYVHTGYRESDLSQCLEQVMELLQNSKRSNLTAVRRRYSSRRYLGAANYV
jgi:cyclin B